jgi:hypothetical protein
MARLPQGAGTDGFDRRKSTAIERRRNDNMRRTLGAKLQQNNLAYLDMLKDIAKGVNECVFYD